VIASLMFAIASSRVCPWLTHPGMAGHSTIYIPSSSRSITVGNFISTVSASGCISFNISPGGHRESNPADTGFFTPRLLTSDL
jgi:hypothetical protein